MSKRIYQDLAPVLRQISDRLPDLLRQHGIRDPNKLFSCPNPAHKDRNPSCGLVPASRNTVFHCFSCNAVGSTLKAAHFLEGLPIVGPGFVMTVRTLAERWGIPMPEIELTPEQIREMDLIQMHADAARVITMAPLPAAVQEKIDGFYRWPDTVRRALGVGGVPSYEWYMDVMTQQNSYSQDLMRDYGLDDRRMFNENCLIFTVKDERGNAVGFASRNLTYQARVEEYEALVAQHGKDSPAAIAAKPPTKFVNSMDRDKPTGAPRNTLYRKGSRLFGVQIAARECRDRDLPLWVFEGYGDCVTAHAHGLTSSVAIGATAFTAEHFQLMLSLGIKHIIVCLDADRAGEDGTKRLVDTVEEQCGGAIGFRAEVVALPPGSDDPDNFIRSPEGGIDKFKALPRMSLFEFRLAQALEEDDADREKIVARMVRLIVNEPAATRRHVMACRLAEKTELPLEVIWSEVTREMDAEKLKLQEQKTALCARYSAQLARNPENPEVIVHEMQSALEALGSKYTGYRPGVSAAHLEHVLDVQKKTMTTGGLLTGWPIFDERFGGIPTNANFLSVPGKPNSGKSSWCWNLAWRLVDHNTDAIVLVHTVDDTLEKMTPRLLAAKYRIPSERFECAGHFLQQDPLFRDLYEEAWSWLNARVREERLILVDMKDIPKNVSALDLWVKQVAGRFKGRPIVIVCDNFHHYEISTHSRETGAGMQAHISRAVKDIANQYDVGLLMTMELSQDLLVPGIRPRYGKLKGSAGMSYDINANIGVYNDMKDMRHDAVLYWEDPNEIEIVAGPGGAVLERAVRKPIVELIFDKSKVNKAFEGEIYYRLDGATGHYEECTPSEQTCYADLSRAQQRQLAQKCGRSGRGGSAPPPASMEPPVPPDVLQDFESVVRVF